MQMLTSVTINCQVTKIVIIQVLNCQYTSIVISVSNVTSPYDCSIREHPKGAIIGICDIWDTDYNTDNCN